MSIAKVQSVNATASGTTITATLTGVTAGNLLTLQLSFYQSSSQTAVATPTDSNGTFSVAIAPTALNLSLDSFASAIYYEANAAAGTHTATVTLHGSPVGHVTFIEWSGAATSSVLDKTASNGSISTTQNRASGTTAALTASNDLALVALAVASGAGQTNAAISDPPSGYTSLYAQQDTAVDVGVEFAYQLLSSSAAQSTTWTWTDSTTAGSMGVIATFLAAAGITLGSQTATSSEGTVTPTLSIALTGQTATFSEGTPTRALGAALSGQTGTLTQGTPTGSISYTLGAQTATFTEGTITASTGGNVTLSLTGQTATFSEGALSLNIGYSLNDGVPLTGQTATFTEGAPTEGIGYALTAQTSTFTQGTITRSISYGMAAQSATFTEGSITASQGGNITKTLTGQTATFAEGVIAASISYSASALNISSSEGSLSAQAGYALVGQTLIVTEGTITPSVPGNVTRSIIGISASFTLGLITANGGTAAKNVMPNLLGLGLWGAIESLEQAGIVNTNTLGYFGTWPVSVTWVKPTGGDPFLLPTATPGTVIGQSINPGVSVPTNSPIQLSVVQYPVGVSYPG